VTVTGADAVVPDASVLATVVFGEPRAEEAVGLLAGKSLVAPDPVLTLNLALERNVIYYDAAYLWLSRRFALPLLTFDEHLLSAPLASHDKALRQAVQATGIQLLS